jgi:hypothetical protein
LSYLVYGSMVEMLLGCLTEDPVGGVLLFEPSWGRGRWRWGRQLLLNTVSTLLQPTKKKHNFYCGFKIITKLEPQRLDLRYNPKYKNMNYYLSDLYTFKYTSQQKIYGYKTIDWLNLAHSALHIRRVTLDVRPITQSCNVTPDYCTIYTLIIYIQYQFIGFCCKL